MDGSYQMETPGGETFDVVIPPFSLDSPHQRRSVN
jgi:ApaG protein